MAKNEYPSYSIYLQEGGQLKHPYGLRKRVQIFDLNEARHAATTCWLKYKGMYDVLVIRFDAPYEATVVHLLNRGEKYIPK